jgi:hypothetical protein
MEALPILALFAAGIIFGIFLKILRPQRVRIKRKFRQKNELDTIDEMFLYGEVNKDDFYGM